MLKQKKDKPVKRMKMPLYGKGAGLRVLADGKEIASGKTLSLLKET